ncbi:MAG: hypothetical protein COA79_03605 [Planctomycetota bacterium]|nr:MAG: hypothetical protein COA79_03605 [Planctomycetota bacterium]
MKTLPDYSHIKYYQLTETADPFDAKLFTELHLSPELLTDTKSISKDIKNKNIQLLILDICSTKNIAILNFLNDKVIKPPILIICPINDQLLQLQKLFGNKASYIFHPYSENQLKEKIEYILSQNNQSQKLEAEVQERTRVEKTLHLLKNKYATIAKSSNEGIFDWHIYDNKIHYSAKWKKLIGFKSHEIKDDPKEWSKRVHPDDNNLFHNIIESIKLNKTETIELKLRIFYKDQEYRWYLVQGNVVKDQDGKAQRIAGSIIDLTNEIQSHERLAYATHHDVLTGMANKEYLYKNLKQSIIRLKRDSSKKCAILYIDIDQFKKLNDLFGHIKCDKILKLVSEKLKSTLRANDFLARVAGDEFAILLDNVKDSESTIHVAKKLQNVFNTPFIFEKQNIYITISIGIFVVNEIGTTPEEVLRNSEIAMNRSKERGKKQIAIFESNMRKKTTEHFTIESALRTALDNNEIKLLYQPIINAETNQLKGVEALIRWYKNDKLYISPLKLIEIAESMGIMHEIGTWVFRTACEQLKKWEVKYSQPIQMSVNCSATQFQYEDFLSSLINIMNETKIDKSRLCIELTESVFIGNESNCLTILTELQNRGLQISIDDFGTGYSSLSYLRKFPVDNLKIDRCFIKDIPGNKDDMQITRTIISMAQNLNMNIIAEGVETIEQIKFLKKFNCQNHQGFFYSKPVEASEIEKIIEKYPVRFCVK